MVALLPGRRGATPSGAKPARMADKTTPSVRVRRYRREDAPSIAKMDHERRPPDEALRHEEGRAWVILRRGNVRGFATVTPLPGLHGVVDLDGFIAVPDRRRGLGTALLHRVLDDLRDGDVRRLTHPVTALQSVAARFLQTHDFYVEHEEWEMTLSLPPTPPAPDLPAGCRLKTFPLRQAVDRFCALYEKSFAGEPWYQPYSRGEVRSELEDAADLRFLLCEREAVGFAWTRPPQAGTGRIEPLGVARNFQGRGLGRVLLQAALQHLSRQGARRVRLGLWRQNERAISLYRRAGFKRTARRFYLARDLDDDLSISTV